jgi:hypothetical protein
LLGAGLLVAARMVRARRRAAGTALSPQDHARAERLLAGADKDAQRP